MLLRRRRGVEFKPGDSVDFIMSGSIEAARRSPSGPRRGIVLEVRGDGVVVREPATSLRFLLDDAHRFDLTPATSRSS